MATEDYTVISDPQEALRGKWGIAIGTFLVYGIVSFVIGLTRVGFLILGGPLALGIAIISLRLVRGQDIDVGMIFKGFDNFVNALVTYLLMMLFILLWTLLLIIPGIIAALSYGMAFFILADNPGMTGSEVLRTSKAMMDGHKMDLFVLYLKFFVFSLLCILTLFIGYLWLVPYMHVSLAAFYEKVKAQYNSPTVINEINSIQ
ncbi:MAG: DUF975 family protein [Bacteroidetes bacterium]|nr:DUF975 family protein [Bacteroidota bacterium]